MYKGLPTFRAGGVMSRADYLRPDGGSNHKTALTPSYFSSNHFSSSLAGMDGEDIGVTVLITAFVHRALN